MIALRQELINPAERDCFAADAVAFSEEVSRSAPEFDGVLVDLV